MILSRTTMADRKHREPWQKEGENGCPNLPGAVRGRLLLSHSGRRDPENPTLMNGMVKTGQSDILCNAAAPYPLRESIGWLWRNISGVRKKNPCGIQPLPQQAVLNSINPRLSLGFVGDIMDMGGKALSISPAVRDFFQSCGYLIGNFEGTITNTGKSVIDAQRHDPAILDALSELFPPDRTLLSVANNHAGDFSALVFNDSLNYLRVRGFHVFGLQQGPFADAAGLVRIVAASMWSNRPCRAIASLDSLDRCCNPASFNVAYPHWGYELEMFPRPAIVRAGGRLFETYGAVMGHHSHVPQPLAALQCGDTAKLLAFSLGDFCTGLRFKKFQYGIVCKTEIGPGDDGVWRIGAVHWCYTRVSPDGPNSVKVDFVPDLRL